jgi:hypothetical protein
METPVIPSADESATTSVVNASIEDARNQHDRAEEEGDEACG